MSLERYIVIRNNGSVVIVIYSWAVYRAMTIDAICVRDVIVVVLRGSSSRCDLVMCVRGLGDVQEVIRCEPEAFAEPEAFVKHARALYQ